MIKHKVLGITESIANDYQNIREVLGNSVNDSILIHSLDE